MLPMRPRYELRKTVIEGTAKLAKPPTRGGKRNVCVGDILRHFTIFGYINSGYFGDVYAMGVGKDPRYTGKTFTQSTKTRRVPRFVMKVMSNSKLNMDEIRTLRNVNKTMMQSTPHFPLYYDHFTCEKTLFRGYAKRGVAKSYIDWTFVKEGKAVVLLMEYAGRTLDLFVKDNKSPYLEITMLFQLMYTVHVMQQHNIMHGDIYMPNITHMPSGEHENELWEYNIGGTSYVVKVGGFIPIFIDFGQSTSGQPNANDHKSSDAHMLLRTWSRYTHHDVVREFIRKVRSGMFVPDTDILKTRYTQTSNIIRDFFPMFLKTPAGNGSVSIQPPKVVWSSLMPT